MSVFYVHVPHDMYFLYSGLNYFLLSDLGIRKGLVVGVRVKTFDSELVP